jgi:hypothetical protein
MMLPEIAVVMAPAQIEKNRAGIENDALPAKRGVRRSQLHIKGKGYSPPFFGGLHAGTIKVNEFWHHVISFFP